MAAKAPITVTLKEPVEFGSQTVAELVLRRPKGKDFRRLPLPVGLGDLMDLAGQLSGQPKAVIDELGAEDLVEVLSIVSSFIPAGRETGDTP